MHPSHPRDPDDPRKNCDHLHVLPKDAHDSTNEPVCLWLAFPTTKTAASAYLFNIATQGQNFGVREGAVDFRAEFRVSCSSSIKWMKNIKDIMSEMERHSYWFFGCADGPTVQMKILFWLVKPDPDNCSTANLRSLLEQQLPDDSFLHIEKHRLQVKPSATNSLVFVTHALKVLAPAHAAAWTTKTTLEAYLHETVIQFVPTRSRKNWMGASSQLKSLLQDGFPHLGFVVMALQQLFDATFCFVMVILVM